MSATTYSTIRTPYQRAWFSLARAIKTSVAMADTAAQADEVVQRVRSLQAAQHFDLSIKVLDRHDITSTVDAFVLRSFAAFSAGRLLEAMRLNLRSCALLRRAGKTANLANQLSNRALMQLDSGRRYAAEYNARKALRLTPRDEQGRVTNGLNYLSLLEIYAGYPKCKRQALAGQLLRSAHADLCPAGRTELADHILADTDIQLLYLTREPELCGLVTKLLDTH